MNRLFTTTALASALVLLPSLAVAASDAAVAGPSCLGQPATIVGTNAGEVLMGTPGDDVILARGGNDTIFARGGDDVICGGGGNDRIRAGAGDDTVIGNRGADLLWGHQGNDTLDGARGNDRIFGRLGDDDLLGGSGVDKCRQDSRLTGGVGQVRACEKPRTTALAKVPFNQMEAAAGFRVKGDNSGAEVYLGNALMGNGGVNRVEANDAALKAGGTFAVEVSYDAAANALSGRVGSVELTYDFDDKAAPSCAVAEWDLVQVSLWERVADLDLDFTGGAVNGVALGKDMSGQSGMKTWTIEGLDFSTDWSVTGDLVASGAAWTGNENSKLEVMVGCKRNPQSPL